MNALIVMQAGNCRAVLWPTSDKDARHRLDATATPETSHQEMHQPCCKLMQSKLALTTLHTHLSIHLPRRLGHHYAAFPLALHDIGARLRIEPNVDAASGGQKADV